MTVGCASAGQRVRHGPLTGAGTGGNGNTIMDIMNIRLATGPQKNYETPFFPVAMDRGADCGYQLPDAKVLPHLPGGTSADRGRGGLAGEARKTEIGS